MDSQLHELPPLKRYRLIHHQQQHLKPPSLCLPAKKRKQSVTNSPPNPTTINFLPAKKRILAFLPFDLNLEYNPTPSDLEKEKTVEPPQNTNPVVPDENTRPVSDAQLIDEEESDDGIVCVVCQSTDGDPEDPIVFCDGCDLMVHAICYGKPLTNGVPEGDWFCTQCLISKSRTKKALARRAQQTCCLCPGMGGAMKPTEDGRWAHIVCALFVPEVYFKDPEGREGIDCSKVPERRWGKSCCVCGWVSGCSVDCSEPKCPLGFHVTCGLKEELCIEYREGRSNGAIVVGFCKAHTDLWKKEQKTGKYKIVARDEHKK